MEEMSKDTREFLEKVLPLKAEDAIELENGLKMIDEFQRDFDKNWEGLKDGEDGRV